MTRTRDYLLIMLAAAGFCFGQAGRAELFGRILDPSGLAVPKARIQAEEQATKAHFDGVSDGQGEYHLLGLPTGDFVLIVEANGFRKYQQTGIMLRLAEQVTL